MHSALPQKLSGRFSFASLGGDVKLSVPGEPLKISLSAIGDFLVNWVIPGKPYYNKQNNIRTSPLLKMIRCGMDKIVMDLNMHAVIP